MRRLLCATAVSLSLCLSFAAQAAPVATVVSVDKPAAGTPILIAVPETSMVLLTTGGAQPKQEWNQDATKNLGTALTNAIKARGYTPETVDPAAYDGSRDLQILKLNDTVTAAIQSNAYLPMPTKTSFDWTLGEGAAELRPESDTTPAAYILFVHASGNYSSGGRVAMGILLAAAGSSAGGQLMAGGSQTLSGTLVDLNTGKIVWYKQVAFGAGTDLRTEAGDTAGVDALLKALPF